MPNLNMLYHFQFRYFYVRCTVKSKPFHKKILRLYHLPFIYVRIFRFVSLLARGPRAENVNENEEKSERTNLAQ